MIGKLRADVDGHECIWIEESGNQMMHCLCDGTRVHRADLKRLVGKGRICHDCREKYVIAGNDIRLATPKGD